MLINFPNGESHVMLFQVNALVVRYRSPWEFMNHVEHLCIPQCPSQGTAGARMYIFSAVGRQLAGLLLKQGHDLLFRTKPAEDEFIAWEQIMESNARDGPPLDEEEILGFVDQLDQAGADWSELEDEESPDED